MYNRISRRAALSGAAAAFIPASKAAPAETDPTVALCERWIAANAEIDRLAVAWSRHEDLLGRNYNWHRLSQAERDAIPDGRRLDDLDSQMDALGWECDALVRALPTTPAASTEAVIANLTVAAGLFYADDHPDAHGLVQRAIRDLKALSRAT